METDQFIGKVIKLGANSFAVILPIRNCEYSGLKEGDMLKVWYKKKESD